MSKLRTVIRHEYMTIIKQPSFWIVMIAIPLLIATVFALSYFGNKSSAERVEELAKELKNVTVIDESGYINPAVVQGAGQKLAPADSLPSLKSEVANGQLDALVYYPENLVTTRKYEVYINGTDFTKVNTVGSLAENLLKTSLFLPLGSAEVITLAQNGGQSTVTTYENGRETAGFNEYVVPGLFVIMFYLIFAFSVGYMLTSVAEEKENRSMEMVLTYVKSRTLIIGKLLAVILVTLTQLAFFTLLAIIAYFTLQAIGSDALALPAGIELSKLVFDPVAIFFAAAFLAVGFLMFAGFMTTTAAAAPSAREANSFSAVFYIGAFAPFYIVFLILSDPENPITKFATFFPLTSPVVTLLRNTVGNMSLAEASLALAVMTGFMLLSLWLAVKAFRLGALEFSSRLKISSLIK